MGLELVAIPLLAAAVWRQSLLSGWRQQRQSTILLCAIAGIVLLQLVPIPPQLWERLPGHAASSEALRLAGLSSHWRPYSLTPEITLRYGLALIPPIAVFLGVAQLQAEQRLSLTVPVLVAAVAGITLGMVQLAGPPDGPLYFYPYSNRGVPIGFFSNRNHQASFLVASLPFCALWLRAFSQKAIFPSVLSLASLGMFLAVAIALVLLQSRAGVILYFAAIAACFALVWVRRDAVGKRVATGLGGILVAALVFGLAFGLGPLTARFENGGQGRVLSAPVAIRAASALQPLGGGLGSFRNAYAQFEPTETMEETYWLHAHDDYLELWLETGWLGVIVLLGFLAWWGNLAIEAWRTTRSLESILAKTGSAASALLLIHSAVDYPLRTLAVACLFAFSCALMLPPPSKRQALAGTRT